MHRLALAFLRDRSGAVTVDWVVLTAFVVGFSAISFWALESTSVALNDATGSAIGDQNDFAAGD